MVYSQGHFGFSVQLEIYPSLGSTLEYTPKVWEKFGDRVGWRSGGDSLMLRDVEYVFEINAHKGHLPSTFGAYYVLRILDYYLLYYCLSLPQRLIECNI